MGSRESQSGQYEEKRVQDAIAGYGEDSLENVQACGTEEKPAW
jgi:hypothetical protein